MLVRISVMDVDPVCYIEGLKQNDGCITERDGRRSKEKLRSFIDLLPDRAQPLLYDSLL
jgi:hypothetical protein